MRQLSFSSFITIFEHSRCGVLRIRLLPRESRGRLCSVNSCSIPFEHGGTDRYMKHDAIERKGDGEELVKKKMMMMMDPSLAAMDGLKLSHRMSIQ